MLFRSDISGKSGRLAGGKGGKENPGNRPGKEELTYDQSGREVSNTASAKSPDSARTKKDENKQDNGKSLSEEGKALLAGMLKELQGDLAKRDAKAGSIGPDGLLGKSHIEFGISASDSQSESPIGNAVFEIVSKKDASQREPSSEKELRGLTSLDHGSMAELDILDINRTLFERVHTYLKHKAGPKGL